MAGRTMDMHISIHSHTRYQLAADAVALLLMEAVLFVLSRIRYAISPLAFLVLGTGVLAGFAVDVALWFWKGIRTAEIAGDVLIVHRGKALVPRELPRKTILSVKFSRVPGARSARLRTVSGRRVRIAEASFPHEEFGRFLTALAEWARR